jgi:hypothetical protein
VEADALQKDPPFEEKRSSRRAFVKRLGAAVAIGLGVTMVGAQAARAQQPHCCINDLRCGYLENSCRLDFKRAYYCVDQHTTCCCCETPNGTCFDTGPDICSTC